MNGTSSGNSGDYYNGMTLNLGYNVAMIAIWGVLLGVHVILLVLKQHWFSVGFICSGILEVLGYVGRTWSHFNGYALNGFLLNIICLTICPVFTLGSLYYQLSKLIEIHGRQFALLRPSILYANIFICSDIISLVIQASGGGVAGTESSQGINVRPGTRVFVAGLAFQVASLSIFTLFMCHFIFKVYIQTRWEYLGRRSYSLSIFKVSQRELDYMYNERYHALRMMPDRWVFRYFIHALTASILLVFVRCAYRLAELNNGWSGYLAVHENYFIILDGVMMSLAVTIMTIFHPGFAFRGRHFSVPISGSRKNTNKNGNNNNNGDNNSNDDVLDIPQPESEQEEDSTTLSGDEKYYSNEKNDFNTKDRRRAFSLLSHGSGPTFTSRMTSLKHVTNPFSSRGGTRKSNKKGPESSEIENRAELPIGNDLVEEPTNRISKEVTRDLGGTNVVV